MACVGARTIGATIVAPSTVEVPLCGACAWRRIVWVFAASVLGAGLVWLAIGRDRQLRVLLGFAACGLLVAAIYWSVRGVDVAADDRGMRWSFRKRSVAEAFAADNDAVIEGKEPAQARAGHDPDGVDHTGLHADSPADGGDGGGD